MALMRRAELGLPLFDPRDDQPRRLPGITLTDFGKFRARTSLGGVQKHLGCFSSEGEAAAAIRAARMAYQLAETNEAIEDGEGWDFDEDDYDESPREYVQQLMF
jgi:hypothetical protein